MKTPCSKLYFDFYGAFVCVESEWSEIHEFLLKDFYAFKCNERRVLESDTFQLKIINGDAPEGLIPEIQTNMQTQSSLSFDLHQCRYNDYYGELTSQIDFEKNEAVLYSRNLDKMHEVAYLIILSRVGKKLDIMGLHKLHAFAVSFKGKAVVCMMPMKGGKSTLLMELLKDPRIKMISDDIPIIDRYGRVLPFPLKIGLEKINTEVKISNPDENIYEMKRTLYGTKKVICIRGLEEKIENLDNKFDQVILIEAFRVNSAHSYLGVTSWLRTFKGLVKHGVIGFGLPMVIEYFWENGWYDFLLKTYIFFSRLITFSIFSIRSTRLRLHLGKKPEKAAREIIYYLEKSFQ